MEHVLGLLQRCGTLEHLDWVVLHRGTLTQYYPENLVLDRLISLRIEASSAGGNYALLLPLASNK